MLMRQQHGQSGAALLEVLIALLLSGVALLALAGVNATALRLGKMSQHRVNAALLAVDMGERMRANKVAFAQGDYDFELGWTQQTGDVPTAAAACQSLGSQCGATEMAALDIAQWRGHTRRLLPLGAVYIESADVSGPSPSPTGLTADIWIAWQEPAPARNAAGASDEAPSAAGECPDGLGANGMVDVRCSHVRVHL